MKTTVDGTCNELSSDFFSRTPIDLIHLVGELVLLEGNSTLPFVPQAYLPVSCERYTKILGFLYAPKSSTSDVVVAGYRVQFDEEHPITTSRSLTDHELVLLDERGI